MTALTDREPDDELPVRIVPGRRRRLTARDVGNYAWLVGMSLLVGISFAQQAGETDRIQQQLDRQTRATCTRWLSEAQANVSDSTTDLGRVIVRTAAAGYELIGCEKVTGSLGPVDPDAYRVAPAPTPGR